MAPIRRYLRITKYSVIEVRIYLDNPALAQTWLLHPRHNVLPRVIEAVRPLVLPKLREEKERARKKSTKKRGIKDIVVEDDFEISIFLTETSTRHSLLTKQKHFHDTTQTKLTSTTGRSLVGASNEAPIDVDLNAAMIPIMLREEDDEDAQGATLADIPAAPAALDEDVASSRRPKRARAGAEEVETEHDYNDEDEGLFISSDDDAGSHSDPAGQRPPHKRRKETTAEDDAAADDDKKKLAMDISYEGFAIYGRVLCLVVKRRDALTAAGGSGRVASGAGGSNKGQSQGQAMMENFIISTQLPAGEETPS